MTPKTTPPSLKVLHLDDDPFELDRVRDALEKNMVACFYKVESVNNAVDYKKRLAMTPQPDVVILDIHIDEGDITGISLAAETRAAAPGAAILMCSTADDVMTIAECLSAGADDFISKQSDKGELSLRVYNSYRLTMLKHGHSENVDRAGNPGRTQKLKPVGATMERIYRRVPLIIDSAISAVFISGESGTGKEVVSDLFASCLPVGTSFVKVNCGAIAPTLLESELFGHVKGAFTGATADKRGLLEAASGGWIFLDEVATLSSSAQVALLRVLENQEVLRVGSTKPISIKVRVLSATNESLESLVKQGKFRSDLWQRLREAEIPLPPLRERPDEIKALVAHFASTMQGGPYQVSGPVFEVLTNVSWKEGNVRELRNCLRAMTEMQVGKLLTPLALPERIWEELGDKPSQKQLAAESASAATQVDEDQAKAATQRQSAKNQTQPVNQISLSWAFGEDPNYDNLADRLLLEITRKMAAEKGKLSLRGLASSIGMSRSTLSGRLRALVHNNLVELSELAKIVGVSEK
jgi:DNA-binding NtrC family response regulator